MVGCHHLLNDMSLSKLLEIMKDREDCSPWGHKELDTTERLNNLLYSVVKKHFEFFCLFIYSLAKVHFLL